MVTSAYDIALIGGGFTIIGALLSYWPARWLMDRQDIILAKAKLRSAFAPAQARIKLAGGDNLHVVCNIIAELTPIHASAIEEFRPFVPESDRDKYQKAWEDCYQTAMQGAPYAASQAFEQKITIIEFFNKKIHDILAFAEK